MLMLGLALAAFLTTTTTTNKEEGPKAPVPAVRIPLTVIEGGAALAKAIKADIEAISGPGSVDISIDHQTLFNVRVAVPGFRAELWTRIYDHVVELYRQYPDLSFDFYLRPKSTRAAR